MLSDVALCGTVGRKKSFPKGNSGFADSLWERGLFDVASVDIQKARSKCIEHLAYARVRKNFFK